MTVFLFLFLHVNFHLFYEVMSTLGKLRKERATVPLESYTENETIEKVLLLFEQMDSSILWQICIKLKTCIPKTFPFYGATSEKKQLTQSLKENVRWRYFCYIIYTGTHLGTP